MAVKYKKGSIIDDTRWQTLVVAYRYNMIDAALDIFGMELSHQQIQIAESFQEVGSKTSVASGHGTGKSMSSAVFLMLFVMLFENGRGILLANKVQQAKKGVFKYIRQAWKFAIKRRPWLEEYFVCTDTEFYCIEGKGSWEIHIKGFRLGNEEALAGEHAPHLCWIVDEASGISDKAMGIVTGSLTEVDNRILLLSQPTRPAGFFYDTHHGLAKSPENPNGYTAITLNSEESPFVTLSFIKDKLIQYGGRDNIEYKIKVLGQFPDLVDSMLLGRTEVLDAAKHKVYPYKDWGWVVLCDVGNGRDKSVANLCIVSGSGYARRVINWDIKEYGGSIDPKKFGYLIYQNYVADGKYPNISVVVDGDGVGSTTATVLEELGVNVQRIRWGKPMFTKEDKSRFGNQRAYANIMAQHAIRSNRLRVDSLDNGKTATQASRIPIQINEQGKWMVMKKTEMAKINIPSPDRWDTYCFSFLCNYVPSAIESRYDSERVRSRAQSIMNKYDDDEEGDF